LAALPELAELVLFVLAELVLPPRALCSMPCAKWQREPKLHSPCRCQCEHSAFFRPTVEADVLDLPPSMPSPIAAGVSSAACKGTAAGGDATLVPLVPSLADPATQLAPVAAAPDRPPGR
jgi:hypothetical protein